MVFVLGDTAIVMRGMWFIEGATWQPLEEGYAGQIETEHLAKFGNQKLTNEAADNTKATLPGNNLLIIQLFLR